MNIPPEDNFRLAALCIDMDGVLLDTERLSLTCWQQACAEHGHAMPEELFTSVIGRNIRDTERIFCDALGGGFDFHGVRARRREIGDVHIKAYGMPVKAGAAELLSFVHAIGLPAAIVTSTDSLEARSRLDETDLPHRQFLLVGGEAVTNGKPAPDIYLKAAAELTVQPTDCLAVEDSLPGVTAAHSAGMRVIMVPDLVTPDASARLKSHLIVADLHGVRSVLAT